MNSIGEWLWRRGHRTLASWCWLDDHPLREWWYRLLVPGPNDVPRTVRRPFLCRCCDGRCEDREYVEHMLACVYPCGACNATGMMTFGQRLSWWAFCEPHQRPLSSILDAYVDVMTRWYDWRDPRCEACGWPIAECQCGGDE